MRNTEPRYDLAGAIRVQAEGPDSPQWRASYERVKSDEARESAGIEPSLRGSFFVPLSIAQRDLTTANAGGYLVAQSNPGAMFLPALQGASIAARLGVQVLPMGKADGAVPVISTPPITQWLATEGATAISTAQPVIGSRIATPKALCALVTFSKQLVATSSPAVENMLMTELARACAAAVDGAVFNGSGIDGEPQGILATPGTATASGASLDLADIADLVEDTVTAGAAMVSPGFATDGPTLEILLTRPRAADVGEMLTDDAGRLAGYPLAASKTGPASSLVFADWSTVILPTWGALELKVDPFTNFATGKISLRAILYVDTLIAHPAAIAIRSSVS